MSRPAIAHRSRFAGAAAMIAAVSALSTGCDPSTSPAKPVASEPWFVDVSEEIGVSFTYDSGDRGDKWLPAIMGGGVAVFDANDDGSPDLYFVNGNHDLLAGAASGPTTNRLFLQSPDGTFRDGTAGSGLDDARYGLGVAVGDIDNDGLEDVYLVNYGLDRLYRNLGGGRFVDGTAEAGIAIGGHGASATFCDYDGDGWLDLFVTSYLVFDPGLPCFDPAGRRDFCGPQSFAPAPDVLLHNVGGRRFEDVSVESGIATKVGHGLGVVCEDLTGDGRPDFMVANDGDANHLWVNQGDGRFEEAATPLGVAYSHLGEAEAGMGVVAADFDGDGLLDVFITHLHGETNRLYRNLGAPGFEDVTGASGLAGMRYTGFGIAAFDAELDGDLDLAVANGRVRSHSPPDPAASVPAPWDRLAEPNQAFLQTSTGRFTPLDVELCGLCELGEISRGLVAADLDADGDLDLVVVNVESPARVYRNQAPRRGRWLVVRALDPSLGRDAIGAAVTLTAGGRVQVRTITRGASYLSAAEPVAHFGIGYGAEVDRLEVTWPGGEQERFAVSCLDCAVTVRSGEGQPQP